MKRRQWRSGEVAKWTTACVYAALLVSWMPPAAQCQEVSTEQRYEAEFVEAMARGKAAFQRGSVREAEQAFRAAYLIHPTDPDVGKWMGLVRNELERRQAMDRAVRLAEAPPAAPAGTSSSPQAEPAELPRWLQPFEPKPGARREVLTQQKRAGFEKFYKEGIGLQPVPGIGLQQRVEIFDEPDPLDDLIIDSKVLKISEIGKFRQSIVPIFTRSWAARVNFDYEPLPRFTYEFDKRHILHEFDARFDVKDRNLETHSISALYSFPRVPFFGVLTVNPYYKRIFQESNDDPNSFEDKDEMDLLYSLQQTENVEYFFEFDGIQATKTRTLGGSKTKTFKGQVRLRVPRYKLFLIPSYEYSDTDYDPSDDEFVKRDIFVDWGVDLTKRLRASFKDQVVSSELSQPGNEPSNPTAETFNATHTLSYELFKDVDVSIGVDYAHGFGYSNFNNVGLRSEVELFKPGLVRCKLGYEWISYYNIADDLSLLYWKLALFQ